MEYKKHPFFQTLFFELEISDKEQKRVEIKDLVKKTKFF
jgi:hypothetical protein